MPSSEWILNWNMTPKLKQLSVTFHFVLILAVPVDKGGSVSPRHKETTSPGEEQAAAPETDLQLAAEATWIQPEQTPVLLHLMLQENPTRWQPLKITIRN